MNKLIAYKTKPNQVPVMQRCIRCMSMGDSSLKQVCSVYDKLKENKSFYCEPCILKLEEKGGTKIIKSVSSKKTDFYGISSILLDELKKRRDRVLCIVQDFPNKNVNEIVEIYNLDYSPKINQPVLRNDLIFLCQNSLIERRKKRVYVYYALPDNIRK